MKRSFLAAVILTFIMAACMKDTVTESYTFFRPVYKTKEQVKEEIKSNAALPVEQPGKIVVKNNYVFLNELDKGIHIIDIADPARPVNIGFVAIPGCVDLAIKGNYLYADCYTALVTIDISNPLQVSLKHFLNGVFPHRVYQGFNGDTSKIIKEWIRVDTNISSRFSGTLTQNKNLRDTLSGTLSQSALSGSSSASGAGIGISGSLARFALLKDRMYTVSNADLKVFNLTIPATPFYTAAISLPQGNIETIFPYKNNLFIGAQAGMFIYDANDPDHPKKLSQFTHARSCDPVIADDKHAYVTLRGGNACGGFANQLDVIDIINPASPLLIKTYMLTSPQGLSKDGNLLLICDGKDGLKIFNAANPLQITLLKQVSGFQPSDVITLQGLAIAVAKDGLYCIDYSDVTTARVISKIPIVQNK